MRPTKATPGLGQHAVSLAPRIITEDGRRHLILTPVMRPWAEARRRHTNRVHLARAEALAKAREARRLAILAADPEAVYEAAWQRAAEAQEAAAAAEASAMVGAWSIAHAKAKAARAAEAEALALTTCRVRPRPAKAPVAQVEAIGPHHPLAITPRPWPAADEARHLRTQALAQAAAIERAQEAKAPRGTTPLPGNDLPAEWRMTGPNGPLTARALTAAEAKAQAKAKAAAQAIRATWPAAEQATWEAKAVAQVTRAKRREARAKAKAQA
jgi:colicin import membrane protein